MKKAVIFDMDGVLVDSEPVCLDWFEEFFKFYQVPVKREQLTYIAGASSAQTWSIVQSLWNSPQDPRELKQRYEKLNGSHNMPYGRIIFPGVRPVLRELAKRRLKMAVASSSSMDSIQKMLRETVTASYFDVVVSGKMFAETKPNPEIYLHTLDRLGLDASECLAVEDSTYGIQAARSAGIAVAAIRDDRFHFDQSAADYHIDNILEILSLVG